MSQFPPSARRLRQARRRGQVPYSRLLGGALTLWAALGALFWVAPGAWARLKATTGALWAAQLTAPGEQALAVMTGWLWGALWPLWLALLAAALLGGLAQTGGLWNWQALLAGGRGQKPRRDPVGAALGALLSAVILGGAGGLVVEALPGLGSLLWGAPQASLAALWPVVARLLGLVAAAWLGAGLLDGLYQRWAWRRGLRMTRQQVEAERKQEASPELRRQRWRLRREGAADGPLSALREARVVLYSAGLAVALAWEPGQRQGPRVLARGQGRRAAAILSAARARGTPLGLEPELARALVALPAGAAVPAALFSSLAACFHRLDLGRDR